MTTRQQVLSVLERRVKADETNQGTFLDSLHLSIAFVADPRIRGIVILSDSLIVSARDSLNPVRADSVRRLQQRLEENLHLALSAWVLSLNEFFSQYKRDVHELHAQTTAVKIAEDWSEFLDGRQDRLDSLRDVFRDSLTTMHETKRDQFLDVVELFRDSIQTHRDLLINRQVDEWNAHVPRLIIASTYQSHVSYRGRDGGIGQNAFAPSFEWRIFPNLRFYASTVSLDRTPGTWDEQELGVGYRFPFGAVSGLSFSYTHYWFSDSSVQENAELNNGIVGDLLIATPILNVNLSGGFNFSSNSEFTTTLSLSHPMNIEMTSGKLGVSIEPTITAVVGEQNDVLTQRRLQRVGRIFVIQTKQQQTNTFSILSYEFSLPVSFQWRALSFNPMLSYIVPKNVIDASKKGSFVSFAFSITVGLF